MKKCERTVVGEEKRRPYSTKKFPFFLGGEKKSCCFGVFGVLNGREGRGGGRGGGREKGRKKGLSWFVGLGQHQRRTLWSLIWPSVSSIISGRP